MGAIAATHGYCEPDLQSSTEQWGMHFTKTSIALQECWVIAHLYEQQIFIGAVAVTQAY